jgi:hypothetical protein
VPAGTLPTFMLIGAQKSGTTSMNLYLRSHPEVCLPASPVYYYDRNFDKGVDWYRSQFQPSDLHRAIGDGTPEYLYIEPVAERMAALVPRAKLIAVLRNPVDRAYSHYWHNRTRQREPLEFADALAAEPKRLTDSDLVHAARYAYFDRGCYVKQLDRFRQLFGRDRLHVLLTDDLREDRSRAMRQVYEFIGVDAAFVASDLTRERNQFVTFRSARLRKPIRRLPVPLRRVAMRLNAKNTGYPPMAAPTRAELLERYQEHNSALAKWLDRDLDHWNR